MDASDNVYVEVPNTNTSETANMIYSISSAGYLNYVTLTSSGSCPGGSAGTCTVDNSSYLNPFIIVADGYNNLWLSMGGGTIAQIDASTGYVLANYSPMNTTTRGVAVDKQNNVWAGSTSYPNLNAMTVLLNNSPSNNNYNATSSASTPYGPNAGTSTYYIGYGYGEPGGTGSSTGGYGMAIDKNQNVWFAGYGNSTATANLAEVLANQGTPSSPSYTAGSYKTSYPSGCSATSRSAACASTTNPAYLYSTFSAGITPYGIAVDGSGNAWTVPSACSSCTIALQEITPSYTSGSYSSGGVITSLPSAPTATYSTGAGFSYPHMLEVDGGGKVWIADTNTYGTEVFNIGTTAFISESGGFKPCLISGTTCATNSSTTGGATGPRSVAVDSTGSVWVANGTLNLATGIVDQIIGAGTPTWWAGATNPGVMP